MKKSYKEILYKQLGLLAKDSNRHDHTHTPFVNTERMVSISKVLLLREWIGVISLIATFYLGICIAKKGK